jgi:hypothetical protein
MQIRLLLFFIFLANTSFAFIVPDSGRYKPLLLLKPGAYINTEHQFDRKGNGYIGGELELLTGKQTSILAGVNAFGGNTNQGIETTLPFIEFRRYNEEVAGKSRTSSFSGTYFGAKAYRTSNPLISGELTQDASLSKKNVVIPHLGLGAVVGKQYHGFVDFGLFAGAEYGTKKNRYVSQGMLSVDQRIYPQINSYAKIHIPLTSNIDFYRNFFLFSRSPYGKKQLLKFGLNDMLSLSLKGLTALPKLAWEQRIGQSGFSYQLKGSVLLDRARYFEIINSSTNEISEEPYFNQRIDFAGSGQLRFYPLMNKKQDLAGLYAYAEAGTQAGSLEVKRQFWEFEKYSGNRLGGGLGYQVRIFNEILIDSYFGLFSRKISGTSSRSLEKSFGIELYWVK